MMTPDKLRKARQELGLTLEQMALMLGYDGRRENMRKQMHQMETGDRTIREPQARLVEAYLEGYRPRDWPHRGD